MSGFSKEGPLGIDRRTLDLNGSDGTIDSADGKTHGGAEFMDVNECYIRQEDKEWVKIVDCNVHMTITRRMQRTVIRGGEGDDLYDEGAESAVYTISGSMDMPTFKSVLAIFRGGQPWFHDPFEDRQMKVLFSNIDYDSATGDYKFTLLEDADEQAVA